MRHTLFPDSGTAGRGKRPSVAEFPMPGYVEDEPEHQEDADEAELELMIP